MSTKPGQLQTHTSRLRPVRRGVALDRRTVEADDLRQGSGKRGPDRCRSSARAELASEHGCTGCSHCVRHCRSHTMQQTSSTVSAVGLESGRDDRSRSPSTPSRACRAIHLYAVRRLIPAAWAASVTRVPRRIRSIRRVRLAGQLRAPLCRFIRGSWLWVVVGVRHQSTSTDRPRVINYPCEQPPETSQLGCEVAFDAASGGYTSNIPQAIGMHRFQIADVASSTGLPACEVVVIPA